MAVNYEILFAKAQNQLSDDKIACDCAFFGNDKSIFITKLVDFMFGTSIILWVISRFFQKYFVSL